MLKKYPTQFLVLFGGQTLSNLGNQIYLIALPWLVYELTKSSFQMGAIAAVTAIPHLLFALFIGVLIDRYNKKNIIWISSVIQFLLVLSIPVLSFLNVLGISFVYIVGFLYSTTSLIFITCYRSIIPEMVEENQLVGINSLIQNSLNIIKMVGPILAGIIIASFGEINAFLIDALTYFILILCIGCIKLPTKQTVFKKKMKLQEEIKEGIYYTFGTVELRNIVWLVLLVNIGMSISLSMIVFHLRGDNHFSAQEVGYVYAIAGVLSFGFTMLAPFLYKKISMIQAIAISCTISGLGLLILPFMDQVILNGVALGIIQGGGSLGTVFIHTIIQKKVPIEYLGRVYSTTQMFTRLSVPLALMLGAWGSETIIGVSGLFFISGIIIVISTMISFIKINKVKNNYEEVVG